MENSLKILLADDDEFAHHVLVEHLRVLGHNVDGVYDGRSALKSVESGDYDLAFIDIRMPDMDGLSVLAKIQEMYPDMSVVIITGFGTMETAIQALRLGAVDFLAKPIQLLELKAVLEKSARIHTLRQHRRRLRETIRGIQDLEKLRERNQGFVGNSEASRVIRELIKQSANADTVIITGETGTGKEVVAREIHFQSSSPESPFIPVSCPALPETLVESELFGYSKGAFTGATGEKPGYFELADGGTLFLDEIADLSAAAQSKILRALETRAIRRVGGAKEINVNIRVIASTNIPLEELIQAKKFRLDLFYRLNLFSIQLLPLRERPDDIVPLAEHFLLSYAEPRGIKFEGFSPEAKDLLLNYNYPGNARELRNIVERAAILCNSALILPQHLNLPSFPGKPSLPSAGDGGRAVILKALEEAKWNRREAAKKLGMPYSTLRYKMRTLSIDK